MLQSSGADEKLKDSLSVVDAKSLYDNLMKEGSQSQDKFTALDVAIARERVDGLGVDLRWVEHQAMVVDSLTKLNGNKEALMKLLTTGTFKLEAEEWQFRGPRASKTRGHREETVSQPAPVSRVFRELRTAAPVPDLRRCHYGPIGAP